MTDDELSRELDKIQAKIDYLQGRKFLDMQGQFDLSQLMLEAAFLRVDWLTEQVRELERGRRDNPDTQVQVP